MFNSWQFLDLLLRVEARSAWLRHALNQASELERPLKFCGSLRVGL